MVYDYVLFGFVAVFAVVAAAVPAPVAIIKAFVFLVLICWKYLIPSHSMPMGDTYTSLGFPSNVFFSVLSSSGVKLSALWCSGFMMLYLATMW